MLGSIPLLKCVGIALASVMIVFLLLCGAYYKGSKDVQALWDAEKARETAVAKVVHAEQKETTKEVVVEYRDKIKEVKVKGDTIIKKVPVYVTKEDDSKCIVPDGFVRVWNEGNDITVP